MIIPRWIQSGCSTLPKNTMSTHLGLRARNYFKYLVHVFFPLWLYAADSSCVLHLCSYLTSQLMLKVRPELPHARQELSPNTSSNRLFTKLNWRDGFLQTGPKLSQVWTIHAVWLLFARVWGAGGETRSSLVGFWDTQSSNPGAASLLGLGRSMKPRTVCSDVLSYFRLSSHLIL